MKSRLRRRITGRPLFLIALSTFPCMADTARAELALTIRGVAQLDTGGPAAGAVVVTERGGQAVTGPDGAFVLKLPQPIAGDAAPIGVSIIAAIDGRSLSGDAVAQHADGDAIRNVGVVTLRGECQPAWIPTFGRPESFGLVSALAVFDDGGGLGPALYAGGSFSSAGGVAANSIARWDGVSWSELGSGVHGSVSSLVVFDDGSPDGSALYAAGVFSNAGGMPAGNIARWNGATWSALGGGVSGEVHALAVFNDGAGDGPSLYVGGRFVLAGGATVNRIAKWNGSEWSALGGGLGSLNGVASPSVFALAVFDDGGGPALYAGGNFNAALLGIGAFRPAHSIAKWDGDIWSSLGNGIQNCFAPNCHPSVFSLAVFDDGSGDGPALYAGGSFFADGLSVNIVKWNGEFWSALGTGTSGAVSAMTVFDDGGGDGPALYVGGQFFNAGGVSGTGRIAKWSGTGWSELAGGVNHVFNPRTLAFAVFDDGAGDGPALIAAGSFDTAGITSARCIASWNGSSWAALGSGIGSPIGVNSIDGPVDALAVFDDGLGDGPALYVGGRFSRLGDEVANSIARWNGDSWTTLGPGVNGEVLAMAVYDDGAGSGPALYVGGYFSMAGGLSANSIAKWNGSDWSALGSGVDGAVLSLTVFDEGAGDGPGLFVGGGLVTGDGVVNGIAKWNGSSWSMPGGGVDGVAWAQTVFDDGAGDGPALYVGGSFSKGGISNAYSLVKWDGASWSVLGSGDIRALIVFDDGFGDGAALIAGGSSFYVDEVQFQRIAKWDGASWSQLGSGVDGDIRALAVFDDGSGEGRALYAGGSFTAAGEAKANRIARWNGVEWSPLEAGVSGSVASLTVFDDGAGSALYVGGNFFTVLPVGDSFLARWRGCAVTSRCPADLSGDNSVNASDLGLLLTSWGLAPAHPADLNGDGVVNASDLATLLTNWGACP